MLKNNLKAIDEQKFKDWFSERFGHSFDESCHQNKEQIRSAWHAAIVYERNREVGGG